MQNEDKGLSLQELYSKESRCFGCGPKNERGLRLRSFVNEGATNLGECIAHFRPEDHHQAYEGMVNGGICGALLDCHSNWTAAYHLMKQAGLLTPLCTVTADFHVKLKRPTPLDAELVVRAHVVESKEDRATIEASIEAGGRITASCRGTFVAVKPGHPAYHRW